MQEPLILNNFYNAQLGNWKLLDENILRYNPQLTMNKGFFSAFAMIHQCLPYLEKEYFNKGIFLNIVYYSHNYGSYPNFQVIGDVIQLNYKPSINPENKQFHELGCLHKLSKKICKMENLLDNFKLANEYFFKYFKFNNSITDKVNLFTNQFNDKRVLGLHYRGTDKNIVKWVTHVSIDEFISIIDSHLKNNNYDIIFISTDEFDFINKMKEKYNNILFYDEEKNNDNKKSIHLNRLTIMENKIRELKKSKNNIFNIENIDKLEDEIKKDTEYNRILFENVVVNSIILSKCNLVLKTHSLVSAYSKIFNPDLEIYTVNSCLENYWPESHIPLYDTLK